jgi:VanZ family protein
MLYCLAIYIQSDLPSIEHIPSFEFSDKLLHFCAYAVMGILFYRAYQTLRIKGDPRLLMLISIVSASLYGISDEIHQYFVPFRDASIWPLSLLGDFKSKANPVFRFPVTRNPQLETRNP